MTTISDAQPGDIYVDANGDLWRIVSGGPMPEAENLAGDLKRRAPPTGHAWDGWQRVFRRAA